MTQPAAQKSRRNATLDLLCTTYPVFRDCQALALGIHKVLQERQPELTKDAVRTALRIHTASTRYLKALSRAQQRFDLDGQPAGEVTAEQRQLAAAQVKERMDKVEQRRKAEAEAQQRQEQLARLEKLAEKFNTR